MSLIDKINHNNHFEHTGTDVILRASDSINYISFPVSDDCFKMFMGNKL